MGLSVFSQSEANKSVRRIQSDTPKTWEVSIVSTIERAANLLLFLGQAHEDN